MSRGDSSPREESNFHQAVYGTAALPLCYVGKLEQAMGVEPTDASVAH